MTSKTCTCHKPVINLSRMTALNLSYLSSIPINRDGDDRLQVQVLPRIPPNTEYTRLLTQYGLECR